MHTTGVHISEIDYEKQIKFYKDNKCDWRINMRIHPCYYNEKSSKAMLGHTRTILENGWLMVDKRFDKLIIALHTASDIEGRLDKQAMAVSMHFVNVLPAMEILHFDRRWLLQL
jgi:hypothetical protein